MEVMIMKSGKVITHYSLNIFFTVFAAIFLLSFPVSADWQKMDPPPDVDKAAHHSPPLWPPTCWMATASNMLAGAGYGNGATVQARADDIYLDMVAHYGTRKSGWTDTAIRWWLRSGNNIWPSNPYDVVTVYGNKIPKRPWRNSDGARDIANSLRRCQFVGLSISWPTCGGSIGTDGHAITCWGDDKTSGILCGGSPTQVIVTDSDRDTGGDVQTYTYDLYTDPNPTGCNEGNGWYFNFNDNHPYIKHIVTLCSADEPGDHTQTQKITGSYRIHQDNSDITATDLHYKVGAVVDILSYKTTINWSTANEPNIVEDATPPRELTVDWDLRDNRIPFCTWVTITTELLVPTSGTVSYSDVYFTYPLEGATRPAFEYLLYTPPLQAAADPPDITGGYVVSAFDLMEAMGQTGYNVVGEYRLVSEYSYDQDPNEHTFILQSVEPMGYYAGNFRFGHSYGYLDANSLWEFNDWMTHDPDIRPLDDPQGIYISLDWRGRLPYPEGENYLGQLAPPECTEYLSQDLDKNCVVNFKDFAIFAGAWLQNTYPE